VAAFVPSIELCSTLVNLTIRYDLSDTKEPLYPVTGYSWYPIFYMPLTSYDIHAQVDSVAYTGCRDGKYIYKLGSHVRIDLTTLIYTGKFIRFSSHHQSQSLFSAQ